MTDSPTNGERVSDGADPRAEHEPQRAADLPAAGDGVVGVDESRGGGSNWLVGGGAMGDLIRSMDWSRTSLGAIERWPQSQRTTIGLCLASKLPIDLIWGPDRIQLYNDGYRVICGSAHPRMMGQSYQEAWASA